MALRKDAPRSARALERAALQAKYKDITLPGLQAMEGIKDPVAIKELNRELRKYYTDARAIAQKAIKRIQESDVPFTDEPPLFPKTSEISNDELFRAVADVNRFLQSPSRELKPRREAYKQLLEDLHEKGMTYLKFEDLKYWDRFRKWVRASNLLGKPYASGDILGDIFAQSVAEQNPTSERWQELYNEVSELMGKNKLRKRRSRLRRK
jgi:hypothetical protein